VKRVLPGQAGVRDAEGEIVGGVFDGNGSVVVVDERKDVDGFVLAGAEGVSEEVPEFVREEVLFGNKTKSLRHPIVDDVVPVAGRRLEAGEQVVDQLVKRDLDPAVGGFEG
jgi:hypothetical protein